MGVRLQHMYILTVIIFKFLIENEASPASAHIHSHSRDLNHERESDGSYSPRDHNHHSAEGVHNSEFDHEAILGSMKEAEEFDNLPPEEAKKRLAVLVEKMDLNNDKYIDRNELKAWILRSFSSLTEEEAQERFTDIDENLDGKVTWQEYLIDSYGTGEDENVISPQDLEEEQLIADDKIMFEIADENNDGFLNEKEFVVFDHPEEHPQMLPYILNQTLRDKDVNKDGFIDFQEFVGDRGKYHDREWLVVEKDKFDNDFDKDNDGRLNSEEILSWVVPSYDEIAEDEVTHLFVSSDDDHDNLLSVEEIVQHHDTFVGSEATDYGEQLHKMHHFDDEL